MATGEARANYEDVLAAPPGKVAEVLDGRLSLHSRPPLPQVAAATALAQELGPPFRRARGGPGGWNLVLGPELHLDEDILVPDLAGWRRERLPLLPAEPFISLAPDWVCEVLSPSTAKMDRVEKLPIYARESVQHVWLLDPIQRMLEVFRMDGGRYTLLGAYKDDDVVTAEPFEVFALELAVLWADVVQAG